MSKQARMSIARHPQPAASQAYRLVSEDLEFQAKGDLRPLRLLEEGVVGPGDIALFQIADRADQAFQIVHDFLWREAAGMKSSLLDPTSQKTEESG